jgi:DNA-binding XRE family transcriptional regulator
MEQLIKNLKYLRKKHGYTQGDMAEKIGVKRPVIGAYEEGRAKPKLPTLQAICRHFDLSMDDLLYKDIEYNRPAKVDWSGKGLRVLPITVMPGNPKESIPLVPVKAAAGYTQGYADTEYIGQLPQFNMPYPELSRKNTCRIFQIQGESMLPVPPGSYVICEYLENWRQIKNDHCYVLVTLDDGIVYKRVLNQIDDTGDLILKSDNPDFKPYSLPVNQIVEVWKAVGYTTFSLPDIYEQQQSIHQLSQGLAELRRELAELKSKRK